ncbi:MAG: hypothetical protein ACREEM_02730, partial [Blastocatellia bacterium]
MRACLRGGQANDRFIEEGKARSKKGKKGKKGKNRPLFALLALFASLASLNEAIDRMSREAPLQSRLCKSLDGRDAENLTCEDDQTT